MNNTQAYLRVALAHARDGNKALAMLSMNAACVTAKLEMPFVAHDIRHETEKYRREYYLGGRNANLQG